jgi:pyridoxal phosphate-dependent aminotransferase EpsN
VLKHLANPLSREIMSTEKRLFLSPPHMSGCEQKLVEQVFDSNWIAPVGPHLERFEQQFAQRIGLRHAVAVTSGTAALHLILRHVGLRPGEEVICSSFTFCASVNPVTYEHGKPVFIDSDWTSWNLDPNLLEEELGDCARRGSLPRAVIAVDILGHSADMDAITQIAGKYDVPVIEDAASCGIDMLGQPVLFQREQDHYDQRRRHDMFRRRGVGG